MLNVQMALTLKCKSINADTQDFVSERLSDVQCSSARVLLQDVDSDLKDLETITKG